MPQYMDKIRAASGNGGRIVPVKVRDLYNSMCEQLVRLSPLVEVEIAPFETRFTGPGGMYLAVSPYRDIFMVSIGRECPLEIRVSAEEGFIRALDLALDHYLSCAARA